jgi:3'-5' exoribonuclease
MSSASLATFPGVLVRDFQDGFDVDQVLLVRGAEARAKRDGGEFLRLTLADRTGSVVAMVWDEVERTRVLCPAGAPIHVQGRYRVHPRYGPQIDLLGLREPAPGSFSLADLLDGPPRAAGQMEADLRELVGTIQEPHLRALLERVLGEGTPTWELYRRAPAAKHYHQAYQHGLLEHCLSVAQGVSAISATFPGIDRDVAVTGALLHDIGKLEAYTTDPAAIDLTDAGRLQGEIPLGYYRIRREIEEIDGFPPRLAEALLHIILSHHGTLEHGSPVVPCTREATLVHFLDNLGGRLGSFDRLQKELAAGQQWSSFDRALGAGAWFALEAGHDTAPEQAQAA